MAHPVLTKGFLRLSPEAAMLPGLSVETRPPPPVPPFLLVQNLSPQDSAGSDITSWKLYDAYYVSIAYNRLRIREFSLLVALHYPTSSEVGTWTDSKNWDTCYTPNLINFVTFNNSDRNSNHTYPLTSFNSHGSQLATTHPDREKNLYCTAGMGVQQSERTVFSTRLCIGGRKRPTQCQPRCFQSWAQRQPCCLHLSGAPLVPPFLLMSYLQRTLPGVGCDMKVSCCLQMATSRKMVHCN